VDVLKKQTAPDVFEKSASVLLTHVPRETVDIWIQQHDLDAAKLTPALLNYNEMVQIPLAQNQAVRYLTFAINTLGNTNPSVHNALISIYASHPTNDEGSLLAFLKSHEVYYDVDFALRLCLQFGRVQSGVHIYCAMELFEQAVELALGHGETEVAMGIADVPEEDVAKRKKLWLSIAEKVISQEGGMKQYTPPLAKPPQTHFPCFSFCFATVLRSEHWIYSNDATC
jgi:vacuolar protein sorting-associated protein 18